MPRRVSVGQLSGETIEVEVEDGAKVAALKATLAQKLDLHPYQVRLMQGETLLSDEAQGDTIGTDVTLVKQDFLSQDLVDSLIQRLKEKGITFAAGLTDEEIQTAESNCNIHFPPDLKRFYQTGLPVGERFFDWRGTEPGCDLNADFEDGVLFDVKQNAFWYNKWGEDPGEMDQRLQIARVALQSCPRLIPIYRHRCMASEPCEAGQPVLSIHQTDIIWYGTDLAAYLVEEFHIEPVREALDTPAASIPFWDPGPWDPAWNL